MTGTQFLVILLIGLCIGIVCIFVSQTYCFINLGQYRHYWNPIYENKIKHFDAYLKRALEIRLKDETIEDVATYAAYMNYHSTCKENIRIRKMNKDKLEKFINELKEKYINEMRGANIE